MNLSTTDKKEIILKYVKEMGLRTVELSRATQIPFFTISQMLNCDDWVADEEVLNKVLFYMETGKRQSAEHVLCNGSGCEALKQHISEKDHLIETQNETIKMLRDKIKVMESKK